MADDEQAPTETDPGTALLDAFGLTAGQRREVDAARADAPEGLLVVARESRRYGAKRGNSGAGLLMHRIKRGDHYEAELALEPEAERARITGWRYVRGSHGSTYLQDPEGTDVPPPWWGVPME